MAWQYDDWFRSSRLDSFRYAEVDRSTMLDIRDLDSIEETGGSIKYQDSTELKVSADLPFVGDISLGSNYIRVYSTSVCDNEEITILHGTFIPSRPSTDYSGAVATGTLDCYSLLKILEDTALEEPLTIEAESNPVGEATRLIARAGLPCIADESTTLLSTSHSYDAGTSYLKVCNDLVTIAGFTTLGIDASGAVRLVRAKEPSQLTPVYILRDDVDNVIFSPQVAHDLDIFEVPNKVIAIKSNAKDSTPLIAVAVNDDPLSIYSTVSRGRVVAKVSDAENQAGLAAIASRVLIEKSSTVESIDLSHPYLPYNIGDALRLVYTKHELDFTGVAVSKTLELKRGMPCKTCLKRFTRG